MYEDNEIPEDAVNIDQMDLNEAISVPEESIFLKKEDFLGKKQAFAIRNVKAGKFGYILELEQPDKSLKCLTLNVTNLRALTAKLGNVPKGWIGKVVTFEFIAFKKKDGKRVMQGIQCNFLHAE